MNIQSKRKLRFIDIVCIEITKIYSRINFYLSHSESLYEKALYQNWISCGLKPGSCCNTNHDIKTNRPAVLV
jgi:hypothetical protein